MTNAQINSAFTNSLNNPILDKILAEGASHYGCYEADFADEVLNEGAELITEYLTGPLRATVALFLKAWALKNTKA